MTANLGAAQGGEEGGGLSLFGINFTSKVLGILIAVAGVGLSGYVLASFVLPKLDEINAAKASIADLQGKLTDLKSKVATKGNVKQRLEVAQKQNEFTLSLLPSVDSVDTLALDISNQLPEKIILSLPPFSSELPGALTEFSPKGADAATNPQYKTYTYSIRFEGTFADILQTIQKIEKLKPLLIIKNVQLSKKAIDRTSITFASGGTNLVIPEEKKTQIIELLPTLLSVSFDLVAYVPNKDMPPAAAPGAPGAPPAPPAPPK